MQYIKNRKAISPVIGIIITVAIVVAIALSIYMFTDETPEGSPLITIKIDLEYDADIGELIIKHSSGDTLKDAIKTDVSGDTLHNLKVMINSELADINSVDGPNNFGVGDEIILVFNDPKPGVNDVIKIIYIPSLTIIHTETI